MNWYRLKWAFFVYFVAWFCNVFLYSRFNFFQDWIWNTYSIGDCFYILSFSLVLSLLWREKNEKV
jgi:hypothetical protein